MFGKSSKFELINTHSISFHQIYLPLWQPIKVRPMRTLFIPVTFPLPTVTAFITRNPTTSHILALQKVLLPLFLKQALLHTQVLKNLYLLFTSHLSLPFLSLSSLQGEEVFVWRRGGWMESKYKQGKKGRHSPASPFYVLSVCVNI